MRLTDSAIQHEIRENNIVINPMPDDRSFQPTSIDLHLDDTLRLYDHHWDILDIRNPPKLRPFKIRKEKKGFLLPSGGFVLGSTIEWIEVPNHLVAIVEGKSSLGRLGITAHITAGFIDPGFKGNITVELFNVNKLPICLYPNMAICQLCFETLYGTVLRPYGSKGLGSRYQGSHGVVDPKAEVELEEI